VVDFTEPGQRFIVAEGGSGGFGNAHFISSIRQTPRVAEIGELGESGEITMELKMLADVGLVGMPNAGKSTFLSIVTSAKPEIADYPFTTLKPNLGVADIDSSSLLIADIPGLIEGAAEGKGLGDEFLRHVERTKVLLHLIDITSDTLVDDYKTIQAELKAYKVDLTKRTQLVALTKTDILDDELIAMQMAELRKVVPKTTKILPISSLKPEEVKVVLRELAKMVSKHRAAAVKEASRSVMPVYELTDELAWKVKKSKIGFDISGHRIEKFAGRTDFESEDGLRRLKDIMRRMGIVHELERQGVQTGHLITIRGRSFEW
jgi:GTP-binding protein